MSDYLLELARNPYAKQAIRSLGLPIPLPRTLKRGDGADAAAPLAGSTMTAYGTSKLAAAAVAATTEAGAVVKTVSVQPAASSDEATGTAEGEAAGETTDALLFDASSLRSSADLAQLHGFFHPRVRTLNADGRIVVLGRPPAKQDSPETAAVQRALLGFVKSLGKEIGRKGSTANLLVVAEGAEDRVAAPLRFLLGVRSAFVSGQQLTVGTAAKRGASDAIAQPLAGMVALVTGAARGIGAAIAARLGEEGAQLVLVDRPEGQAGMDALIARFSGTTLAIDLTDPDAADRILTHVQTLYDGVDIVVNNAGVTRDRTLAKMDASWWDLCLGVNLGAAIAVTEALRPKLIRRDGRVIFISSIGGLAGNPGQTNYGASKAGLIGYAEALAPKLGRRGVTVNCVAPGFIETEMTASMPAVLREAGRRLNALSQGGLPQDIADAVTFLATPGASGLTAHTLRVCGLHTAGA